MKNTQKMYLEVVILSEVSQTEEDKYHTVLLIYKQNVKNCTNEPIYKTEMGYRCRNQLTVTKGGKGEGINWKIGIDIHTLLYIK